MGREHILIIEDDEDIQQLVSFNLVKAGFHVSCVDNGEDGLGLLKTEKIDCLLLDIMLPGKNGFAICRQIREDPRCSLPIIMLTAKIDDQEIIEGLECGANDYVTKPFSPKVLIARIKAALRRQTFETDSTPQNTEKTITIKNLKIYPERHELLVDEQKIQLTYTEFAILSMLVRRPGWVYTRQQIIDTVRGDDYAVTQRMIDVQVFSLRKKLGQAGNNIETVRGIGYRFKD
nr:response regulator transcription factor [Desulfobulbaceae bacterium]